MQLRALPRAFYQAARLHPPELSAEAQGRLRWLRAWEALRSQGLTSREASGVLTLPRASLYRWRRRLAGEGPRGLEGRSRRPKRCRRPSWSPELAQAVSRLREKHLAEGRPINLKSLMEDIDVPIAAWRFD